MYIYIYMYIHYIYVYNVVYHKWNSRENLCRSWELFPYKCTKIWISSWYKGDRWKIKIIFLYQGFFNDIKHFPKIPVSEEVLNVTLYNIWHLYIKVQSFTFAENKVEKHKQKNRKTRPNALRKEIKRSVCNSKVKHMTE